MTNAAGFAAINLKLVGRAHRAAVHPAGGWGWEGWSWVKAGAVVQDGFHDGKTALPRAPHLANASRKAQNLLGGNLGLILGRALISLFDLYLCLQLDPLPKHLPAFIRQELPTFCIRGHT